MKNLKQTVSIADDDQKAMVRKGVDGGPRTGFGKVTNGAPEGDSWHGPGKIDQPVGGSNFWRAI